VILAGWTFGAKAVGLVLTVAVPFGAGVVVGSKWVHGQWAEERAELAERDREATHRANTATVKRLTNAQGALDAYIRKSRADQAAAAAARDERDRLLEHIASAPASASDPGAAARVDGTGALRDVLGQCVRTVQTLALDADRLKGKLTGLQLWVSGTCTADENEH
jgi:hypothetical protein